MKTETENKKDLELLWKKEGKGNLLVCYEADRNKPHAESSYRLYPIGEEQSAMTAQFLTQLHIGVEAARISAFIPDTRMEVYSFSRMSELPPFSRSTPAKEYITDMLLPHIRKNGLKPVVSVNLRDMVFIRSEGLSVEPGGILRLNTAQIDRLVDFRRRQDELAARYGYIPQHKLPLRVIETSKGILVFSGSDIGWKGIDSFYKFLLCNYFSMHAEPGPIKQYCVNSPSDRLYGLIDISCRKELESNRYTFDFLDTYTNMGLLEKKGWILEFATDMTPSDTEYLRMEDFSGRRPEGNNKDICRLLALQRHFDKGIILNPAFRYGFQFREFVTRMDRCINGFSEGDSMEKILDDMRKKSDHILRTEFRVRGYGICKQPDKKEKSEKTKRNNKLKR